MQRVALSLFSIRRFILFDFCLYLELAHDLTFSEFLSLQSEDRADIYIDYDDYLCFLSDLMNKSL